MLRYNNTFGKHDVGAFFGYEQYRAETTGFSAEKKGLIDWSITDITSGAEMNSIGGSAKSVNAIISYFGRVNYAYAGKYLLEASFRSDASSKFAPGHRNSFFPSGSVAWRISEEPFFESLKNAVNSLKIPKWSDTIIYSESCTFMGKSHDLQLWFGCLFLKSALDS